MKHFKNILGIVLSGSICLSACTKNFQEINIKPGAPSTTKVPPLINGLISNLFLKGQEQTAIHNDYYYQVTQLGGLVSGSGYVLANGVNDIWTDYYNALQNIHAAQDIINATEDKESMNNVQAILYILKAYKTFRITDQFGDIPFSDAGKSYTYDVTKYRPKYDDQQVIYDSLLAQLKWAVDNIQTDANAVTSAGNSYVSVGSYETFFNNDMTKWRTFANSLRLRYGMQLAEKDPATAASVVKDVLTGGAPLLDGLDTAGEIQDVGMWPEQYNVTLTDSRWWSFQSHKYLRLSSTVWNLMADNTTDGSIFDPRAKLFFETNAAGNWAPFIIGSGISDTHNPYDANNANDPNAKDNVVFSPFNYYILRDIYFQPELFITPAEVHFLKAEAYLRGIGVDKNASMANTEYQNGVKASVNFWYYIAENTNDKNTDGYDNWNAVAPPAPTSIQITAFLNNPKVAFTGSDDDDLKKIYAQEWLSFFREPWLAFNLWRRTGGKTPVDPKSTPSSTYTSFYRLPYPQDEAVNNTVNYQAELSKIGTNSSSVKVWWQP